MCSFIPAFAIDALRPLDLFVPHFGDEVWQAGAGERRLAAAHLIQHAANGPQFHKLQWIQLGVPNYPKN